MKIKNILGFALGPLATAAFGLVTIPAIAWIFSPEDVGRLNVFQITVSFCLLLSVLGLDQAYVREYHEASDRAELLKACFVPGFLVLLLLTIGTVFFSQKISKFLYGLDDPRLYLMTLLAFISSYISRFLSLILRMQERGLAFSMSQVLPKALQLMLVASMAFSVFHKEFLHLLLITVVSISSVLMLYTWNTRKQWRTAFDKKIDPGNFYRLLAFGFPLIFSGLAYWGLTATSTFVLRSSSSLSELAIYSVACSFAGAAVIFQAIFSIVWAPTVYKWVAEGVDMKRVDVVAQQALAIVCAIVVACGSVAWITDWLLPLQYMQVKYILLCCIVQPLLYTLSEVTCVGIAITRRTMLSLWVTVAAMLTNIGLSVALVPHYGAAGAAIANALAFLVFFVGRTEASAWVWRKFPRRRLYLVICSTVSLSVLTVLLASELPFPFGFAWAALIPAVAWGFRAQWRDIAQLLQSRSSTRAEPKVSQVDGI